MKKEAKEKLGMEKLTNKQTVYVTLPKKDYVESATEKVVLKEEKNMVAKNCRLFISKFIVIKIISL